MIKPVNIPSAAGLTFGAGDVRHFSEDDAVSVPGLQNPTRQLAYRDSLLAATVNELVSAVNNKEQFVPLPILRTVIPPGVEEIVTNFRIPVGFEARVLNAAIASTPSSTDLILKIFYNQSFGGLTGSELISTTNEYTAGSLFYNNGELIVTIRNSGSATLEAAASVTLTVRPITERNGLLIGTVVRGEKGGRGGDGVPGLKGDPGAGAGSGSTGGGIRWLEGYSGTTPYVANDAVYYVISGVTSSYVNKLACTGIVPTNTTYWDLMASGASTASGLVYRGSFNSANWEVPPPVGGWKVNDFVIYNDGTTTQTYLCILAAASTAVPPSLASILYWVLMASGGSSGSTPSGEIPTYTDYAQLIPFTCPLWSNADGTYAMYLGIPASGNISVVEHVVRNTALTATPRGLCWFDASVLLNLNSGAQLTIQNFPSHYGSYYALSEISYVVSSHSLLTVPGLAIMPYSTTGIIIVNLHAGLPHRINLMISGSKIVL